MRAQHVAAREPRVEAGLPFVEALARRMAATMPHSIDLGDLVQDGVIGLIDAAHRFDEERGIKFETFAERRIRGAMIDALRKDAWPRGVRRVRRELEAAREKLRRSSATSRRWPTWPPKWAPTKSASAAPSSASTPSSRPRRWPAANISTRRSCRRRWCRPSPSVPTSPTRRPRRATACARAIDTLPAREQQGDRALLLRRSHDEGNRRRDRRQRVARLAAARPRHAPPARGARRRWPIAAARRQRCARRSSPSRTSR